MKLSEMKVNERKRSHVPRDTGYLLQKQSLPSKFLNLFSFFQIVEKMPQYSPMPPSMERSILNEGYTKSDLGWQ